MFKIRSHLYFRHCFQEFAPLFGGTVSKAAVIGSTYYKLEKPTGLMKTENQLIENQPLATGTLMFHSGIIGCGPKASALSQTRPTCSLDMVCFYLKPFSYSSIYGSVFMHLTTLTSSISVTGL